MMTIDDALIEGEESVDLSITNITSMTSASNSNPLNSQVVTVDDSVSITDNDTADWELTQTMTQSDDGVDEGSSAIYTLKLNGVGGAMTGSGPADSALQAGDTATIDISIDFGDTNSADFDEALATAVEAAVLAYNTNAGTNEGDNNSFMYDSGTVTYYGDGTTTTPMLMIDLDTFDDNLIEGAEDFSLTIDTVGGTVASQLSVGTPDPVVTTINDNDTANWTLTQSTTQANDGVLEGTSAMYVLKLDGSNSGMPGAAAVQDGDTASIDISLLAGTTEPEDFDETLEAAVMAAIDAYNGSSVTPGDPNTFTYSSGTVTYHGDGSESTPMLMIDLDTADDALIEGDETFSLEISNPGGDVASQIGIESPATISTTIVDLDKGTWSLFADNSILEGSGGSSTEVVEGNVAAYKLEFLGTDLGLASGGGAAVQSGDTASVSIVLNFEDTEAGDFAETLAQAVMDAIQEYNTNAGTMAGDDNSFSYSAGVITYHGDGVTTFAFLNIELDTLDDSVVEGPENFSLELTAVGGTVESQLCIDPNYSIAHTTIVDNDNAFWNLTQDSSPVNEGGNVDYIFSLLGDATAGTTIASDFVGDYAPSEWMTNLQLGNGSVTFNGNTSLTIVGSDESSVLPGGPNILTSATTTMAQDGVVTFDWSWTTDDGPSVDPAVVLIDGQEIRLTDDNGPNSQSGSYSFYAAAGTTIGFGVRATDDCCGEGTLEITNFAVSEPVFGPAVFQAGETAIVEIQVDELTTTIGLDYPSPVAAIMAAVDQWNMDNPNSGFLEATFAGGSAPVVVTYLAGSNGDGTGSPTSLDPPLIVNVTATDDNLVEGTENVEITINNPDSNSGQVALFNNASDITVNTEINDNDTATWTLSSDGAVNEGDIQVYVLKLDGTDGATTDSGTEDAAVQAGDTATIDITLNSEDTNSADFDAAFDAAVMAAVMAYNTNAGTSPGDNNSFAYAGGTVTYYGDGSTTTPMLMIELDTFDDNLIEGDEDFSLEISNAGGDVASQLMVGTPSVVSTTITDNDTADWVLTQSMSQSDDGVDEGDSAVYTLKLDGTDGAMTDSGTADAAVQAGDTATVGISLTNIDTLPADFAESLDDAIEAAVLAYNTNAGTAEGDNNSFAYDNGTVTYYGDGSTTTPMLMIDLDTFDDNLIEGDEDFSLQISSVGGDVASQLSIGTPDPVVTTINDNDSASWTLNEITSGMILEGLTATYELTLDGTMPVPGGPSAAVQLGNSASIDIALTLLGPTSLADFDEAVGAEVAPLFEAVQDAVDAYNTTNGGSIATGNFFEFDSNTGTVTFYGDGNQITPTLTIDLDTFDDTNASQPGHLANLVEPNEDFQISITNPQFDNMPNQPQIGLVDDDLTPDGQKVVQTTIVDNDTAEIKIVFVADAIEGNDTDLTNEARVPGLFHVMMSNPSQVEVIVDVADTIGNVSGIPGLPADKLGSATPGLDYQALFSSVTFSPGSTLEPLSVDVIDDMIVEGTENVIATIFDVAFDPDTLNPGAITIIEEGQHPVTGDPVNQASLDIIDDDSAIVLVGDAVVDEDAGTVTVSVTLDKTVQHGFTVPYTLGMAGDTATGGDDYDNTGGVLSFSGTAGEVQTITIMINNDDVVEDDEILYR